MREYILGPRAAAAIAHLETVGGKCLGPELAKAIGVRPSSLSSSLNAAVDRGLLSKRVTQAHAIYYLPGVLEAEEAAKPPVPKREIRATWCPSPDDFTPAGQFVGMDA